jgi:serine/threonine protein kinase
MSRARCRTLAPEQILDFRNVKPAADIYSMGATLYHLLTGQLPYDFRPGADPLLQILDEPIVDIRRRKPDVSPALARVVEIAMRKDPAQRYPSANEMRRDLMATAS